jgi:hypothetical protein
MLLERLVLTLYHQRSLESVWHEAECYRVGLPDQHLNIKPNNTKKKAKKKPNKF